MTAPEGTRNDTLNREAFTAGLRVSAGALDAEDAFAALANAARVANLDEDEIAETITASMQRGNASAAPRASVPYGTGQWECTNAGGIRRTFKNAMLALYALGVEASRNTFSDKFFLSNAPGSGVLPPDYVGPLSDNAVSWIRKAIQDLWALIQARTS